MKRSNCEQCRRQHIRRQSRSGPVSDPDRKSSDIGSWVSSWSSVIHESILDSLLTLELKVPKIHRHKGNKLFCIEGTILKNNVEIWTWIYGSLIPANIFFQNFYIKKQSKISCDTIIRLNLISQASTLRGIILSDTDRTSCDGGRGSSLGHHVVLELFPNKLLDSPFKSRPHTYLLLLKPSFDKH